MIYIKLLDPLCGAQNVRVHVRFGSKADICAAKSDVRFTPESGHVQCTSQCLLWANSGHDGLFNRLIGTGNQRGWDGEAKRFGRS
jgi:hypothetical protein